MYEHTVSLLDAKVNEWGERHQTDKSYLCHTEYIDLRTCLEIIIRPVDIDLLEHCGDGTVGLNRARTREGLRTYFVPGLVDVFKPRPTPGVRSAFGF
jgi:hypothetical protein